MKLFLVAAIAAFPVLAHADAAEDALEARQGFMKMLSINMGTLSGMAKGDIAYDAAAATQAGTNLEALSQYGLPALFIDGTSTDDGVETEALPAIWEEPDLFTEPAILLFRKTVFQAGWIQTIPFARPQFEDVLKGVKFMQDKDYPPRGTLG